MEVTQRKFDLSVKIVKNLNEGATNDELLQLYGLYKQSLIGDCNTEQPSKIFNPKENAKWNAWVSRKGLDKTKSMEKYSDLVMKLIDKYGIKK